MEILKNFKFLDERWEEFPFIKILLGEDVFAGLPICKIDFQAKLRQPVLVIKENDIPLAVEFEELQHKLANTKRFYFVSDEKGLLKEVDSKDAKIVVRLPITTAIEQLVYINGQVLLREVTT